MIYSVVIFLVCSEKTSAKFAPVAPFRAATDKKIGTRFFLVPMAVLFTAPASARGQFSSSYVRPVLQD